MSYTLTIEKYWIFLSVGYLSEIYLEATRGLSKTVPLERYHASFSDTGLDIGNTFSLSHPYGWPIHEHLPTLRYPLAVKQTSPLRDRESESWKSDKNRGRQVSVSRTWEFSAPTTFPSGRNTCKRGVSVCRLCYTLRSPASCKAEGARRRTS